VCLFSLFCYRTIDFRSTYNIYNVPSISLGLEQPISSRYRDCHYDIFVITVFGVYHLYEIYISILGHKYDNQTEVNYEHV